MLIIRDLNLLSVQSWTYLLISTVDCPSNCYCLRATTDPSLLKTDCSDKNYWLVPMGVPQESTHV